MPLKENEELRVKHLEVINAEYKKMVESKPPAGMQSDIFLLQPNKAAALVNWSH